MSNADTALSPTEEFTDLIVRRLDEAADGWDGAIDRLVREYPDRREVIYGTAEVHRQLTRGPRPAPPPARVLQLDEQIGAFRVVRLLRSGGMGEVYLAEQQPLDRLVALKVIRRGFVNPVARAKFVLENQVLARLHHSNCVPVHFAGEDDGLQYCVMHLVDGVPLDQVIAALRDRAARPADGRGGDADSTIRKVVESAPSTLDPARSQQPTPVDPLSAAGVTPPPRPDPDPPAAPLALPPSYFAEAADLIAQVADAVQHAHEHGVCHRDVKPSNLIADRDGKCWVLDFGLAAVVRRDAPPAAPLPSPNGPVDWKTTAGGTPQYMPPEQFDGKTDPRADVYSIGLVLYELLTLRPAYPRGGWAEVRRLVTAGEPADPRRLVRGVPADLVAIARKATRKEPGERYQTAAALADDLRRWRRGEPTVALPRNALDRLLLWVRRHPWRAGAVAAVCGSLLAVVVAVAWGLVAGAQARAAEADLRAAKAGEEAEKDRGRAYAALLASIHSGRLARQPVAGWFEGTWGLIRQAAGFQADLSLRSQAAAATQGADVVLRQQWKGVAVSSLAWDDAGRLLMGGVGNQPARLWDGDALHEPRRSTHPGPGPAAFRPDGTPVQFAVTPADRFTFVLSDMAAGKPIREVKVAGGKKPEPPKPGTAPLLTLSPDARFAAATGQLPDGKRATVVWDATTGAELTRLPADDGTAVTITPADADGGSFVVTGHATGRVDVWALPKGEKLSSLQADRGLVAALAVVRTPRHTRGEVPVPQLRDWWLAVGTVTGHVSVWDLGAGVARSFCHTASRSTYAVAFSPDGTTLCTAGRESPELFDAATGRTLLRLPLHDFATAVAFSTDGARVAIGTPGETNVWEVENGHGTKVLRGLVGTVENVRWSGLLRKPAGNQPPQLLAAVSQKFEVAVWTPDGRLRHVFFPPVGDFADNVGLAFSPDNTSLVCSCKRTAVRWDLETGKELKRWALPAGLSDQLLYLSADELYLFRVETPDPNVPPYGHADPNVYPRVCVLRNLFGPDPLRAVRKDDLPWDVRGAVGSAAGKCFVVTGCRWEGDKAVRRVKAFAAKTGEVRWSVVTDKDPGDGALLTTDPDGTLVAEPIARGGTAVLDVATGRPVESYTHLSALGPADGFQVGANSGDMYTVFRRGKDAPLFQIFDDRPNQSSFRFSPDGGLLAWPTAEGAVRVCDLAAVQKRLAAAGLGW